MKEPMLVPPMMSMGMSASVSAFTTPTCEQPLENSGLTENSLVEDSFIKDSWKRDGSMDERFGEG